VLLLLPLFLFRQLLLLVLFLVFFAALVSHACSFFQRLSLEVWITARLIIRNRREPTLPQLQLYLGQFSAEPRLRTWRTNPYGGLMQRVLRLDVQGKRAR
jgi:hypothetical protein